MIGFHTKLGKTLEALGPIQTLFYGLDRWLAHRGGRLRLFSYHLVAQPITLEPFDARNNIDTVTVREVGRGDPVLERFPLDETVLRHRFDQGAACLTVWRGDRLLGCFWFIDGSYLEDEVRCRFVPVPPDKSVWDFDVFLLPEHRLGRGFLQLWQAVFGYLRERGKTWSLSRISAYNSRSLASHRSIGARIVGHALFIKGRRRQLMLASRRPFIHFSRREDDLPTLEVGIPAKGDPPGPNQENARCIS